MAKGKAKKGRGRVIRPAYTDRKTGERRKIDMWWTDYYVGGERVRESTGTTDHGEATAYLDEQMAARHSRAPGDPPPSATRKTTLDALLDLIEPYLNGPDSDLRESSRQRIRTSVGALRKTIGRKLAKNAEAAWRHHKEARYADGIARGTINREARALRLAFQLGLDAKIVRREPKFKKLPEPSAREVTYTDGQLAALIAKLPASYVAAVELGSITGWRSGAVLSRRWDDIADGFLDLGRKSSKNGQPYRFPVEPLAEFLERQHAKRLCTQVETGRIVTHIVFDYDTGEPITQSQLSRTWSPACIRAGLCEWKTDRDGQLVLDKNGKRVKVHSHRFHDLRRYATTLMHDIGIPETKIMEFVGWETPSMFRRYKLRSRESDFQWGHKYAEARRRRSDITPERKILSFEIELEDKATGKAASDNV